MRLTESQVNQIPALTETMRNTEIAAHFGCTARTVQYWIKRWRSAGKKIKTKKGPSSIKLVIK